MKKTLIIVVFSIASIISIAIIVSIVNFWNSRSIATALAEQELNHILKLGTKKEDVINFLEKKRAACK